MRLDRHGDLAAQARDCEASALDAHFGLNREILDAEFVDYEDASVFLTISDDGGTVHAAARFILPNPKGLKSLSEMSREPWSLDGHAVARDAGLDLTTTWDVASFSRRPGLAGGNRLALALSHGLILASRANGVTSVVAILNETVRSYLAMFGLIYIPLPGAATLPFDGSPASTPVYASYGQFLDTARRLNPEGYRLVAQGIGLDGITVPPLSHFELQHETRMIDLVAAEAAVDAGAERDSDSLRSTS